MIKYFIVAIIVIFSVFLYTNRSLETKIITINNSVITVELAETNLQRQRGLSDRNHLLENNGMLFIFEKTQSISFWMKDMNFPLDIIWIDKDKKIIGIEKDVSPDTYPKTFIPSEPIVYVLETNAGWSENNNINIGDFIEIN